MQHQCKVTVLETTCSKALQQEYLADPNSGPCPCFKAGDERLMIACCNDGTRPVIYKTERIDIPETPEEAEWLAAQNFTNTAEDAYVG